MYKGHRERARRITTKTLSRDYYPIYIIHRQVQQRCKQVYISSQLILLVLLLLSSLLQMLPSLWLTMKTLMKIMKKCQIKNNNFD